MHQNNADLIRPGCRGGHDQFNWESLRTMKYHDREQYLGQTTVIGYLDKGGKWRKKDWYIKQDERNVDDQRLEEELRRVKEEDERRMRIALGLEQPDEQKSMQVKLTKEEIAQLTKKSKIDFDDEQNNERKGLGNGPMQKQTKNTEAQYLLEAYGNQEEHLIKKEEDGCLEKKIKKEKKHKKEKKEKKNKEEKKHKKNKSEDKKERKKKK